MRGEYVLDYKYKRGEVGSPPLARGVLPAATLGALTRRITPACAGSTVCAINGTSTIEDHPRLRGEYLSIVADAIRGKGSPPLARGVLT